MELEICILYQWKELERQYQPYQILKIDLQSFRHKTLKLTHKFNHKLIEVFFSP